MALQNATTKPVLIPLIENMTFSTHNNESLYEANLKGITKISLNEGKTIDLSFIKKARDPAITILHCEFRPDLSQLPETLEELSISTQYEVWRKDLPKSLRKLHIKTPCCEPKTFDLDVGLSQEEWECEYFYISTHNFGKYNSFKRSVFDSECDNIHRYGTLYTKWFHWQVDGDPNFVAVAAEKECDEESSDSSSV